MLIIKLILTAITVRTAVTFGSCSTDKDCPNPSTMGCLNKLCYVRDNNCNLFGNKCSWTNQECNICTGGCFFPELENVAGNCRVGGAQQSSANQQPAANPPPVAVAPSSNPIVTTTIRDSSSPTPVRSETSDSSTTKTDPKSDSKPDWVVICSSLGAVFSLLAGFIRFRKQITNWWRKKKGKKGEEAGIKSEGRYSYKGREDLRAPPPSYDRSGQIRSSEKVYPSLQ